MKQKRNVFLGFVVLFVTALFTLAGCGEDGNNTGASTTPGGNYGIIWETYAKVYRNQGYTEGWPASVSGNYLFSLQNPGAWCFYKEEQILPYFPSQYSHYDERRLEIVVLRATKNMLDNFVRQVNGDSRWEPLGGSPIVDGLATGPWDGSDDGYDNPRYVSHSLSITSPLYFYHSNEGIIDIAVRSQDYTYTTNY